MIGAKGRKRIGTALLAAVLVLSQLGATAYAEGNPAGTGGCANTTQHILPHAAMQRRQQSSPASTPTRMTLSAGRSTPGTHPRQRTATPSTSICGSAAHWSACMNTTTPAVT